MVMNCLLVEFHSLLLLQAVIAFLAGTMFLNEKSMMQRIAPGNSRLYARLFTNKRCVTVALPALGSVSRGVTCTLTLLVLSRSSNSSVGLCAKEGKEVL